MTRPRKKTLTQAELKRLLNYDPDTGQLTWKPRPLEMFSHCKNPVQQCNAWNVRHAEKPAFTSDDGDGYLLGTIHGKSYKAHRVIVCLMSGKWPPNEVDHINGIRDDNRWENINPATQSENSRNTKMRIDNTSGITGVCWHKASKNYIAQIHSNVGKRICKYFSTKEEAIAQRKAWERDFGYSIRHGK